MVFRKYVSECAEAQKSEGRFEISSEKYVEWYVNKKNCRLFRRELKNEFSGSFLQRRSTSLKKSFNTPITGYLEVTTY